MRVLLVEDHIDVRRLFEQVIEARGHEVTACEDGESAWVAYGQRALSWSCSTGSCAEAVWTGCNSVALSDRVLAAIAVSSS